MHEVIDFILQLAKDWGYVGIVLLMTLESCFVPFPSEVVMIPAGYLAARGELSLALSIACGVVGSVLGALINYYLCFFWGKRLVLGYGHIFGITPERFARFEAFFNRHGEFSTFTCRLLPGIRQYISMPAGLVRMNLGRFVLYTALGSFIWVSILAALGYYLGENEALIKEYLHQILIAIVVFVVILSGIYIFYRRRR